MYMQSYYYINKLRHDEISPTQCHFGPVNTSNQEQVSVMGKLVSLDACYMSILQIIVP